MDSKKIDKNTSGTQKQCENLASSTILLDFYLEDSHQDPSSPSSSSSSETIGEDTCFEPSIDMLVNDFDDEETLKAQEALEQNQQEDYAGEIEQLHQESEIPLEELLARYGLRPKIMVKKLKRSNHKKKTASPKCVPTTIPPVALPAIDDEIIVIEESDDEVELLKTERAETDEGSIEQDEQDTSSDDEADEDDGDDDVDAGEDKDVGEEVSDCAKEHKDELHRDMEFSTQPVDLSKRTHLMKLYPEKFDKKMDEDFTDEDEEDDDQLNYVKKTIMVGGAYQASIPTGLSKYGDVLPYENEDKLIWEPSQVSEQEIEEYLIRVREIKASPVISPEEQNLLTSASALSESDQGGSMNLIKDDEQALHLLVQCGYNFKEALRRKRLYAVPLTGSMSLWSEEECRYFEEGIHKFGKDFRKIRQTQVRTRSIRELVQFYYLWKKTERRDMDFVDSDAIDHMDVYLDFDERDTGSSNGGVKHVSSTLPNDHYLTNQVFPSKQHHHNAASSSTNKNFSIMNETKRSGSVTSSHHSNKKLPINKKSYRPRSSLLSTSQNNHHVDNINIYTIKSTSEKISSSSSGNGKNWRSTENCTSTVVSSSSEISSTTGTANQKQ